MGKLFYLIGKSSTGKDTIFQSLLEREELGLKPLVLYTTRPMRAGETPGVQYHFTDEAGLSRLQAAGKVIELRAYQTVHGIWKYFTADTEATDLERFHYIAVGVLESFRALRDYYGADRGRAALHRGGGTESGCSGPLIGSAPRRSPAMRSCAGGSWLTARISQRNGSVRQASRNGFTTGI